MKIEFLEEYFRKCKESGRDASDEEILAIVNAINTLQRLCRNEDRRNRSIERG